MSALPSADRRSRPAAVLGSILGTVVFTFAAYLTIGFSLAVLPGFVHERLGYGAVLAGLTIGTQYLATLLSRPQVGRMADTLGPKRTVLTGLILTAASGFILMLGALAAHTPVLSVSLILLARLALGCAESCVGTGVIMWGMGELGHQHTARVISWNGVATYGGLAAGAPLGVLIDHALGLAAIGGCSLLLILFLIPFALRKRATIVIGGKRAPIHKVISQVMPYGAALALGSVGFGGIATFIALHYAAQGWPGAALALTMFGLAFVGTRFMFARTIGWLGGYRVAMVSFAIETLGLVLLWLARDASTALIGATVTGLGFSLIFPALGVEAVNRVEANSRGAALGFYSVFMDVAMALTGPFGGWMANRMGFASIYGFAAAASIAAALLTTVLYARERTPRRA